MNDFQSELAALFSALVDESIDAADFARLNELIETDPAARKAYIRLMNLHADLPNTVARSLAAADEPEAEGNAAGDIEHPVSLKEKIIAAARKGFAIASRPTSISLGTSAIVVTLLIALMAIIAIPGYQRGSGRVEVDPPAVVAQITRVYQPVWPENETERRAGSYLTAGTHLELQSGVVELVFGDGAKVVLQGPFVFEAVSRKSASLAAGRLTAVISQEAVGFSVRSPCMNLIDLGTEFGMFVEDSGSTNAHVFQGSVEVSHIDSYAKLKNPRTLQAGEAIRITREGNIEAAPEEEEAFVRSAALEELIAKERLENWRKFIDELSKDPGVTALYAFDQNQSAPQSLANLAENKRLDAQIEGPAWESGRWEEKGALRFQQAADRVSVDFGNVSSDQLTLAAWVKLDQLAHSHNALVHSDDWERNGATHWTILADGRMEFALYGTQPEVVRSDPLPKLTGRWMHLAVVYDGAQQQATFYFNGAAKGTRQYTAAQRSELRQAGIGNWTGEPRNLSGKMDELILFRKALSGKEIRQLFAAGIP